MSSIILYKYRLYCTTENQYVYWWLDSTQSAPTTCPNNSSDVINTTLTCIISQLNDSTSIVSTTNSTNTPLGVSATFTGGYENIQSFSCITLTGISDTPATLYADFSNDASTIDQTCQLTDGLNGSFGSRDLTPKAQYFRARVVNQTTAQTTMRLQTIYKVSSRLPTSRGAATPNLYEDCILTRSLLYAQNDNNQTFNNVNLSGENNLRVSLEEPLSSLGLVLVSNLRPKIQISANYGYLSTDVDILTSYSGNTSFTNGLYTVNTGTSFGAYAVIRSKRLISYFPGTGIRARFSAMFSTPANYSLQAVGLHTSTDFIGVGYYNTLFGVNHRIPGYSGIYVLTITNGTSGNEVHSITLNSIASTTIATTGTLTSNQVAQAIASQISTTVWNFTLSPFSNNNKITFIQYVPNPTTGTFSYASSGTATGSFSCIQAGVANSISGGFISQSNFNIDVLDGSNSTNNPSGMLFNPSKLNLFQVCMSYSGTFLFYILTANGKFILFHRYLYSNLYTTPSQQNPSYHIGWIAASLGSTTTLSVSGTEASGFIEGYNRSTRVPFSHSLQNTIITTTESVAFAIRSTGMFQNMVNGREITPINLSMSFSYVSTGGLASCIFYLNPTMTGDVNWNYVNSDVSCAEYCEPTSITPTGGTTICNYQGTSGGSVINNLECMQMHLVPGDVLAIALVSTCTMTANISLTWTE